MGASVAPFAWRRARSAACTPNPTDYASTAVSAPMDTAAYALNLVTALVPSDTACFERPIGRHMRVAPCTWRDERVVFFAALAMIPPFAVRVSSTPSKPEQQVCGPALRDAQRGCGDFGQQNAVRACASPVPTSRFRSSRSSCSSLTVAKLSEG